MVHVSVECMGCLNEDVKKKKKKDGSYRVHTLKHCDDSHEYFTHNTEAWLFPNISR